MALLQRTRSPSYTARLRREWRALRRRARRWKRTFRRARRALNAAPRPVQIGIIGGSALILFAAINIVYHVIRKPTEMFWPMAGVLNKAPAETWAAYGSLFRDYSTAAISPELLAALAQVEGAGNPVAHTYWRWRFSWNPFEIYAPASSAVGMYQMTDGAFAEARHYCVHHHEIVAEGPWWDMHACWFNALYARIVPGDAVELTAIYLDRAVTDILARRGIHAASAGQKEELAAIVHLCGAVPAEAFARRGFRLAPDERCGDHAARRYVDAVEAMKRRFARLAAAE